MNVKQFRERKFSEMNCPRLRSKRFDILVFFLVLLNLCCARQYAEAVEVGELFTDGMVLQRDSRICVWGTGAVGEKVQIKFADQSSTSECDKQGRWRVYLDPLPASAEPRTLQIQGRKTIRLNDVLIGDVWLAGGQSNMGSKFKEYSELAVREAPEANHSKLRFFTVPKRKTNNQVVQPPKWVTCSPETVKNVSAVSYFFSRDLHRSLNVPIGIIVCAWGGTMAENWISRKQLLSRPETAPIVNRYDAAWAKYGSHADYRIRLAEHQRQLVIWKAKRQSGQRAGARPPEPMGPEHFQRPAGLYHSMFRTVSAFSFRGIIFYQGESNILSGRGYQYRSLLPLLVRQWRTDLGADLPFLTVQLPTARAVGNEPWAELRESQWVACRETPNCEMAVVIEYGEANRLHPKYKAEVGGRLADLALGKVYEQSRVCEGPLYREHRINGNRVVLKFDSVGSGLVTRGSKLTEFVICDATGEFVPANAVIENDTVIVTADGIKKPVAVRYGWKNYFEPSLFNQEGYSATPFRTDNFKLETQDNR